LAKKPLGIGGFATVFEALEIATGRRVAFKRLRVRDAEAKRRFRREITVQTDISHPHVMPVLDRDPLGLWYTMPLAAGSLEALSPRLTPAEVIRAIRDAGTGLLEGHRRQLTHRDVTPRNILALQQPDGSIRWVIADWGLVRLPTGQTGSMKTEGPLGTARFIAPELLRDPHSSTARSDIYSLGMVAAVVREQNGWGAEVAFDRFIHVCTATDPQRRPHDVADALALLARTGTPRSPTFLVWTESDKKLETHLVRCADGHAPERFASRPGLFICDGERLFEWRVSSHRVVTPKFRPLEPDQDIPAFDSEVHIQDASLVDFDTGASFLISPIEPRNRTDETTFDLDRTARPIASAGPLLFVTLHAWSFTGGAHGNTEARFIVFDTRNGLPVEALSATEFATTFEAERKQAIALHRSSEHFAEGWLSEESLQEALVTLYRPIADRDVGAAVEVQITFDCSYAGSDGRWSSYSESKLVRTKEVPVPLRHATRIPPALAAWLLDAHAAATAAGWSEVPDVPRAERWIEFFVNR
jgi:serine/threonine protein kinase